MTKDEITNQLRSEWTSQPLLVPQDLKSEHDRAWRALQNRLRLLRKWKTYKCWWAALVAFDEYRKQTVRVNLIVAEQIEEGSISDIRGYLILGRLTAMEATAYRYLKDTAPERHRHRL